MFRFESYAVPRADLRIFRVIYAAYILVGVIPIGLYVPAAPEAFFYPPLGLPAVFTGLPSLSVIIAFNVGLVAFSIMLLVGWRVPLASFGVGLTMLLLNSWAYSVGGKINHDILLVLTPLVLAWAWTRAEGQANLAVLGLLIAWAMFTAGWAKATSGWLNPTQLCTYGHLAHNFTYTGRETWLAGVMMDLDSALLWKVMDWAAVALELGFIIAWFLGRRVFSRVLIAAVGFHLGIGLLFGIWFWPNVVVYAAFVPWRRFFTKLNPKESF